MAQAAEADDWQPVAAAAPADDWEPVGGAQQPASPGFFQSIKDHVEPVMNAMGQGFREGWGPDRWGMSDENVKWLSKVGIYAPEGATSYSNPFQAMNELLGETIARTGELASRGAPAVFRSLQGGVKEGLEQAGTSPQFARDIASIPDAFMGSPHPTGRPGAAIAERTRMSSLEELARGERAPDMRDFIRARELNVIGPERPRLSEGKPAEVAEKAIQPTVAYHGSPHDFAAFSTDRIGTGEGAQSYGHGLYFAESEGVARSYQRATSDKAFINKVRELYDEGFSPSDAWAEIKDNFAQFSPSEQRLMQALEKDDWLGFDYPHQAVSAALRDIKSFDVSPETADAARTVGNMYGVRIHANKEAFLDWDKSLSEQPKALSTFESLWKETGEPAENWKGMTAAEAYDRLAKHIGGPSASDAMHEAGIPGIKYLDAGSRGKGDGTRNFVVFSDKDVEITHKNGEAVEPQMSSQPRAMAAERTGDDVLKGPAPGGGSGNPWRDRFEHFVGKLETSEDVKTLIREAATTNDEFTAARAGDVPLAHVEGLAEAAGVAPQLIDHTGVGRLMKNDNEVRIGMQLMLQTTDNVMEAARNARADATPESLIKLQEAIMRRDLAVEQVVGARAEWGRTGRVFQEFMRDVKDQEGLTSFLKDKGRTPTDLQGIADSLGDLDRTQAARVLSDLHQRTPGVFYWTWVNGLISGLLTHTKYVAANALYAASEHGVTTPLAAVIGKAKQAFGAEVERVYFGEALAATYGGIAAVPHSLIATAKSIYSGQRAVLKSEIEVHKEMVARGDKVPHVIDQAVNQVTGRGRPEVFQNSDVWGKLSAGDLKGSMVDALGRTIGAPGDMAMGIHTFFKVLGERAGLEAEAYRGAAKEGLSPAEGDFWRRRSELSENPTTAMRERAIAGAYKGTFMNELGPHGKAWQRMTKETPGLRWLFPFSHIPVNLMKATYEHTPFAFLDAEMRDAITGKSGGVAQDRAIARMVVGSSIMGYFVHQALNGRATGDYPVDPQERDSWKLTGKQPNSILIGNTWISLGKFGPAGNLANLAANIGYVIPHIGDWWSGEDEEGMTKATFHAARAASNMVADEVGMMSLKMIFEAMHDEKKGAAWAASQAGSVVPFSSLLSQTASGGLPGTGGYLGDPYMREARTFFDGLKYKIPGQRETLLPKRDWLGQPMPNPQYGNILRQKQVITDPVSLEMERLEIHPSLPQDRIGGVKLSRPLYDEYQTVAGAYTKTALESLVSQPGWTDLPTSARIGAIHANITQSRQLAGAVMQAQHPELIGIGMQQRMDFITGETLTPRPKQVPEALRPH